MLKRFLPLSVLVLLLLSACSQRGPRRVADGCFTIKTRLDRAWNDLRAARGPEGDCEPDSSGRERCQALRWEIERLAMACPEYAPAQFAIAAFAFDDANYVRAQQTLDSLLADLKPHPEAEILRARVALAQGNVPFAIRFLQDKVQITADHPGLREALASALYLGKRYGEAAEQLGIAGRLGAPDYRIAYHSALIHEAEGAWDQAIERYESALQLKPGWQAAESRLRALKARR